MDLKDKKVLVLGLGVTGISAIKALYKLGANIVINDSKKEEDLKEILDEIKKIPSELVLGRDDMDLSQIDLVIKSPGIPPSAKIVQKAVENNIKVITDLELAYKITPTQNLITITGTNGKTTTTALTGEIFKEAGFKTNVVGNIGVGILDKMIDAHKDDVFVIEASSFQLEHTIEFKPKVSLIINITPDHLDWHGSLDNYINAKLNILKNQDTSNYTILNYDDQLLKSLKNDLKSKTIWFSTKEILEKGIYIENNNIVYNDGFNKITIMSTSNLKLKGNHNLENILGSIGIAISMNIGVNIIKTVLSNFTGVEHRLEFVKEINNICFYNDSKGTNPDASIKAIEAIDAPIILIAGGYDKGSTYDDFVKSFKNKVKLLILFGQTKEKIKEVAISNGFYNIELVENMEEAVKIAFKLSESGDNVLLSPASASWGMYKNFEERGKDFKNQVYKLME